MRKRPNNGCHHSCGTISPIISRAEATSKNFKEPTLTLSHACDRSDGEHWRPQTRLLFFQDANGAAPVWEWLKELRERNPKAYAKCVVRIRRLAELGHELQRTEVDLLQNGIYELRARLGTVNYRILYFFHGRNVAVLAHAITKESEIPAIEINRTFERKRLFRASPDAHTFIGDLENA
jgi:phage-related protein